MPTEPVRCGTDRGYKRHHRRGETACDPCKQAHAKESKRQRLISDTPYVCTTCRGPATTGRCRACAIKAAHDAEYGYQGDWVLRGGVWYPTGRQAAS